MSDFAPPAGSPLRLPVARIAVPAVWLLVAAVLASKAWSKDFLSLFADTDDATRMVVVRDLMGGQNWFDHVVHRYNTPFGAEIHWSRLIDFPLSLLIRLFDAVAPGQGEHIVLFVWPLLLLLPALYLVACLARRLGGPGGEVAALIVAGLALPVSSEFAPGRVDHHSVQMVLILWLAVETLDAPRRAGAALRAGLAAATSLAIGAETLIIVAAAIAAFGLDWVMEPRSAPRLLRFGWAFAAAMLGHFLVAVGPSDWFAVKCDANSIVFVAAAFGVALAVSLLVRLPFEAADRGRRLIAGFAGAALIAAALFGLFPDCAAGPFAMLDPWLKRTWLDRVIEIQPLWKTLGALPDYTAGVLLPVLLALGLALVRLMRRHGEERRDWLVYALLLLAALVGMVVQLRGARLSALIAAPAAAALIVFLRQLYLDRRGPPRLYAALGLVGTWIGASGLVVMVLFALAFPTDPAKSVNPLASCLSTTSFAALARLSPARIAAPIDLGPYIALMTPHAVVGAPYHRNGAGIGDSYRIFGSPEAEARAILKRRGVDLIVSCDAMLALTHGDLDAPDSLEKRLGSGDLPAWLTPVADPASTLKVYRVAR